MDRKILTFKRELLHVNKMDYQQLLNLIQDNDASTIVVGSKKGKSTLELFEALEGKPKTISVTEFTYNADVKKAMKKKKITALENMNLPIQDDREMRETLLMFGPGVKAAMEVAAIAVQQGLVTEPFLAVAGKGLDTVLLVVPSHPQSEQISNPLKRMLVKRVVTL